MKIAIYSILSALGLFVYAGLGTAAESQKSQPPIVIRLSEILRESEWVTVQAQEAPVEGQLKPAPSVTFFFQTKPEAEVTSLFNDALISKRVIRVVNGTNVVAEGRIAGRAFLRKSEKETLCGLSLGFGSVAEAERAALAMREDMETTMRRKIEDRRSWRINGLPHR
jgi:hypothetical protein